MNVGLSFLKLTIEALAAYRITRLVATDYIFFAFRRKVSSFKPFLGYLVSCSWCLGLWVACAVVALSHASFVVLEVFAVAALVGICARFVDREVEEWD